MFFRVVLLVALVLGGLWYLGGEVRKRTGARVDGSATTAPRKGKTTPIIELKRIEEAKKDLAVKVSRIQAPKAMLKNGKVEPLSERQQHLFKVLTVYVPHELVVAAGCESDFIHVGKDGQLYIGKITPDRGALQVNPVHDAEFTKYGLDYHRFEHHVAVAVYLYTMRGLQPWKSSAKCQKTLKFLV
jgi:hypothetical protein